MINGGQPIDPGLIQALGSISASPEQNQALEAQSALAQSLRSPTGTQHVGNVAIRNSPLSGINNVLQSYNQSKILKQQTANANQLRDVRGKYLSAIAAQGNPGMVHPDSQAAAAQMFAPPTNGGPMADNPGDPSQMMPGIQDA